MEDGRSWNASILVAVPEECVTERSKRLPHLLPVPGDQEQSARRTVSDNQGEYSVGENREALVTPCQVSGGADSVDEHRLAASETPIQITIGPDSIEEQRREVLTSPLQVSQDECPVVGLRLEDSAAPTQAQGTTWSDGPCRGPSTRERRRSPRPVFISKDLTKTSHVFVRDDTLRRGLQPPYHGPYLVTKKTPKYFEVLVNGKQQTISIDRLKPAHMESTQLSTTTMSQSHSTSPRRKVHFFLPQTSYRLKGE